MRVDASCLIVGAGPVGMTLAHQLDALGVSCIVVERADGPSTHPSAHVVNARSLEIWRQGGFDMDAISSIAKDPADAGSVNFFRVIGAELIGRLPFERQGPEQLDLTPTPLRNISQHRLGPILADQLRADGVDLRYGYDWESSTEHDDHVVSTVTDRITGDTTEIRSRWLVAADGASSTVRRAAGIEMIGPPSLQHFVAVHLGLALRPLLGEHLGVLHFVLDPVAAGTFVAHDLDDEAVFMFSYDPTEKSTDAIDAARCESIVRRALGTAGHDVPIDVRSVGTWNMSAQVAERMRDGRTFLVGDAAHRFPPTGGLGLNTGVADAQALAWRLAAVEAGWAGPGLLATYEQERRPVAQTNCEQSATNALKIVLLAEALGLLEAPTSEQLAETIADPDRRSAIDAAVEAQRTHFDMLGLQLGYAYADGALVRHGDAPALTDDPGELDPSTFDPVARVGGRLPHGWLVDGRSTLDLVSLDSMTLITLDHDLDADEPGEPDVWANAVANLDAPVRHARIGAETAGRWSDRAGIAPREALLVRPDQHIAWRGAADRADELHEALDAILDAASTATRTDPARASG